ncbi:hypothetical protein Goshw_019803 [Gossypium schwendimanii]|uniref:RNase H type-1 domain-containing protein n=1 Tax=Gossypium schwendimanii TaxID=34291 RepID=A0A7J9KT74_GOSSC|nr:hypothetical protein [Gossypium schwendimanii]
MRVLDKRAMADLMTTLWNCWNNRNNFIFRGKETEAKQIWERASNLSKEFRICNMTNEPLLSQNAMVKKWKKPPKGFIKINFDATVSDDRIGFGTIIRDEEGFVLGGGGGFKEGRVSVEEAECMAFEESINVARRLKLKEHVLFETDHVGLSSCFYSIAQSTGRKHDSSPLRSAFVDAIMVEDINELQNKLSFLEEEATKVMSTKVGSNSSQGFEAWAIGKVMSEEKVNREAMYHVFKSLWFTKEECLFNMVPYIKDQEMEAYAFNRSPFWVRISNIPMDYMDRLIALEVGNAIGEVIAIDWRDRDGG